METNNLFTSQQHGFRSNRSCTTQLLEVIEDWYESIENNNNIDCIYLDFKKAFDTVPHQRLLSKMRSYGIRGNIQKWTEQFLQGRSQSVRIGNTVSEKTEVISGIPQGSVLGPILFLIFINDLPDVVQSTVKLFADDTKLYSPLVDQDSCSKLQDDLDSLADWSNRWQLKFNASKCKSIHIGRTNTKHQYHMKENSEEVPIQQTDEEKDIGVTFDNQMKFDIHITSIVKKANQRLGLIRRSFEHMDKDMFVILHKALIRPLLEYATVVWSPWLKKHTVAIEQVQRRATRLVKDINHLTYEERLKSLGLPTLAYRRERADMVQLYKIMNGIDKVHLRALEISKDSRTRGHCFKLVKKHHKYAAARNSFTARCINPWNYLPQDTVNSPTLNSFKSNLNKAWKQKENKFLFNF